MITYTVFPTELGWTGFIFTPRGLYATVLPQTTAAEAESRLLSRAPLAPVLAPDCHPDLAREITLYCNGRYRELTCKELTCEIDWSWATVFQRRTLSIVRRIPAGSCRTYGEVAGLLGMPRGARAVGQALAANQIPIVIPCHRVMGRNGQLGGFTGASLEMKTRLLSIEGYDQ
jgi:methylated-DNA-[protein]-cysteine S-methyltransferase